MAEHVAERVWSAEEFLAWESQQPDRHELIDNRIYPMAGASRWHNVIAGRLIYLLISKLGGRRCEVYPGTMQVHVDPTATYTYPDVAVICGRPRFRSGMKPHLLENPTLLFEVLSETTESIDRDRKLRQYLDIPSLEGYFLISQNEPLIEAFARRRDEWLYRKYAGLDNSLVIEDLR